MDQHSPTPCYRAARPSTQAIRTLLHRLTTTSAGPDLFAYSTVASTSDRLRCNQPPPQHQPSHQPQRQLQLPTALQRRQPRRRLRRHSYTYFDTETFTDAESRANAQAASYAATASITIYEKETHCSTPTPARQPARKSFGVASAKVGLSSARLLALLICSAAACSMVSGALLAFFHPEAPNQASHPAAAGLRSQSA